jgi:hypothetical protein
MYRSEEYNDKTIYLLFPRETQWLLKPRNNTTYKQLNRFIKGLCLPYLYSPEITGMTESGETGWAEYTERPG